LEIDFTLSCVWTSGVGLAPSLCHTTLTPENSMATCIGQTVFLKGTLSASEDIRIAGRVEGEIHLHEHVLIVQLTADLSAGVSARSVIVEGAVRGDITAGQNIALQHTASVSGKIAAPRIAISDGADFNGRIETSVLKA
jgi:cytoskeletal protein CcmA (bactofilin family)